MEIMLTLNGKKVVTSAKILGELLKEHGIDGKPVLVEYNKSALTASQRDQTCLAEGDQIEIFVLGAGG